MKTRPIFIFSLPRSGSTLLQKLIMTHPQVISVAEPWLLLPFISILDEEKMLAIYSHQSCYRAFEDFVSNIGKETYLNKLRKFTLELYDSVSEDNYQYFIDKTPRYYMIIPQIANIFPEAKFVFLFRNPLAIYSSIMQTWSNNGYLKLHNFYIDLYEGPQNLVKGYKLLKDKSIKVTYENLVSNKQLEINKIATYLNLKSDKFNLEQFKEQKLKGRMGDPTGINQFSKVSKKSLKKWKLTFNNLYRKKKAKDYINHVGEDYLELANVNKNNIIKQIDSIPSKNLGIKDFFDLKISNIYRKLKLKFQIQTGWGLFTKNNKEYPYG